MSEDIMTNKLNFEMPAKQTAVNRHPSKFMACIMILIFLGVCANIFISLKPKIINATGRDAAALNADLQKKLALKLEKQGLYTSSAIAWKKYITKAGLDDKETALVWYRIGKLYQNNHRYEQALASYYRSESFSPIDSIASEIAIRIQECLESMGKFSAMRHELSNRVTMTPSGKAGNTPDPVIAEIGTQKITASDLDQHIEKNIERQINRMAPYLPDDERNKQKEAMEKQFASTANRMMFLNQFVAQEILYRKARQDNLAEDPKIKDLINDQEKSLLANLTLEKEYENRIKITLDDLKTYYEANKKAMMKGEKEQPFEDVKNDIYKTLRSQKEKEIQQNLLTQLKDQYNVVLHQSALSEKPDTDTETQQQADAKQNKKI